MKKVLIAFTAGAILAVLFAPDSGKKTRKKIAHIGTDLKDGWNDIADKIADKIDSLRDGVDDIADKAVSKIENTQFDT